MDLASQLPPLPPLVAEDYQWQQSPADPSIWRRRAIGTENVVGLQPNNKSGEYDLFFSCTVQFHSNGLTVTSLEQAIQKACLRIRSQHPEVAQTVSWEKAGSTWIQSHVTNDQAQLDAWARNIVTVETSNHSAADICNVIEEQRQMNNPVASKSVTIYVTAPVESRESVLSDTTVQFLFHVNHLYFDGMSIRRLAGDFFHTLGQLLAGGNDGNPALKSGPENLSPPVLDVLDRGQGISDSRFETHRAMYMESTMKGMVSISPLLW